MKKERAPDLTSERIEDILVLLDGWSGKLTWDAVIDRVKTETGIEYSRFTLGEYPRIAEAFRLRKQALRGHLAGPRLPRDERLRAAMEQAERYRQKSLRLERENQALLEQFMTWAINAERAGVTVAMLSKALLKPARERSRGVEDAEKHGGHSVKR